MAVHWVTGAASGIGAELARALLAQGHAVCAADLRREGLETLRDTAPDPARLHCAALDVRDAEAWAALLAQLLRRFGRLDVLHNVAGVLKPGYMETASAADVDFHVDVNLKGVMHGSQCAARQMLEQGGGHIINIASLAGLAPVPGLALYSASKFGVRGYSLAIAHELKGRGVKVTVVCPDAVQTPMLDLQREREEAALTFSGGAGLTVAAVRDAILGPVLRDAPLELTLPRGRGALSRLAGALPALSQPLLERFRQRGLREQARLRRGPAATPLAETDPPIEKPS
jgi:NADP-dependent 3-hydroxy acid dehydrogenase YdfG